MKIPFVKKPVVLPERSRWLPAVAFILCLCMFGMAAGTLITVGADPESPPSGSVTSVAANGFAGLRRLLTARGHATATNRFETGKDVSKGDVEIITVGPESLTQPAARYSGKDNEDDEDGASASASASSSSASSDQASQSPEQAMADMRRRLLENSVPDKARSDHILRDPLGRAVIVVAPKWQASQMPDAPRWGRDPMPYGSESIARMLEMLAPMSDKPMAYKDDEPQMDSPGAGRVVYPSGERQVIFDEVPYVVGYGGMNEHVVLTPAAGQNAFTAPLDAGRIDDLQSVSGPNLVPLLLGPKGEVLVSRVVVTDGRPQPAVPVYLISDPDLLDNQILSDPQKVVTALGLIDALSPRNAHTVVFNLTFNGLSFDHDLIHALSRPPFVAVPLSILIFGLVLMWASFARFGPAQAVEEGAALGRGVRVLADNAARLMAIALKETKLGPAYAQMVRDDVLKTRGYRQVGLQDAPDDLAERLGVQAGAQESFAALRKQAGDILTVHQLIDVTRRLHAWKLDIVKTETPRGRI